MKKTIKVMALILVITCAAGLISCRKSMGEPVMTLEGHEVTDRMFEYWVCSYKAMFLTRYSDVKDTDEFWDSILFDGVTAEEYLKELTLDYIKSNLVSMYLFDEYGLEITEENRTTAENIIKDMKTEYAGGNTNSFNSLLSNYGVNENILLNTYIEELKSTYVYNHVFENNLLVVSDEEKQEYLEENYSRIRQIYINNKYDYDNSYYDESGNFIMAELDEAAKAEKDAKIEAAEAELASGKDFDEVYEKYSEEQAYPNGYYLSTDTKEIPSELLVNSHKLAEGETASFETDYGTHIIKRLEMDEAPWSDDSNKDFFENFSDNVYESKFTEFIQSYYDKIVTDEEAVNNYSVREALPNYSFQY